MKKSASNCTFLITLLIISFSSLIFAARNPTCHPQDQIAINKIQTAFGVTPTPNCCDWDAVTCSDVAPFRVIEFSISDNSTISGQIPAAITKLTNLIKLSISKTSLSGPIPAFLANLKNLNTLDLSENALTGSIPPQLSQLQNLSQLSLGGNKLTGSIPESFGHFSNNFKYLNLSSSFLTGAIPKSLGNLNLINLDLSQNSFTGDASFLFGKKKITLLLLLQRNKFRFDLSNVEFPSSLRELDLGHNNIFGSLPQQLTQLELNFGIDVSYNNLCGTIPQGGILQAFGVDSYSHNKCLCGAPLPPCKIVNESSRK